MMKTTGVYIRQGQAYVPVTAQTDMGVYMDAEPVLTADLTAEALTTVIEQIGSFGHPRVPHPSQDEWRSWRSPVLKAAKVRSWKQMAQGGASYSIVWSESEISLHISHSEDPRKWQQAPVTTKAFPKSASLRTIVEAILEDVRMHPELLDVGD